MSKMEEKSDLVEDVEKIQVSEKIENSPKTLAIQDLAGFLEKLAKKQEAQDKIIAELVAKNKTFLEILENPPKPTPTPEDDKICVILRNANSGKTFTAHIKKSILFKELQIPIVEKKGKLAERLIKYGSGGELSYSRCLGAKLDFENGDLINYWFS